MAGANRRNAHREFRAGRRGGAGILRRALGRPARRAAGPGAGVDLLRWLHVLFRPDRPVLPALGDQLRPESGRHRLHLPGAQARGDALRRALAGSLACRAAGQRSARKRKESPRPSRAPRGGAGVFDCLSRMGEFQSFKSVGDEKGDLLGLEFAGHANEERPMALLVPAPSVLPPLNPETRAARVPGSPGSSVFSAAGTPRSGPGFAVRRPPRDQTARGT